MSKAQDTLDQRESMIQSSWLQAAKQCSNFKLTRASVDYPHTLSGTALTLGE